MPLITAPTLAEASDFAEMGHPAFVRSLGIGIKHRRAIRCLDRWTESGERAQLAPLADEIVRRTAISVGFPEIVKRSLAFERLKPFRFDQSEEVGDEAKPDPSSPPIVQGESAPASMPAECTLLARTYASGGLEAATAVLGPAPSGLIPLPSPGTCLGFFKSLKGPDGQGWGRLVSSIKRADLTKLPAAERDAILRDIDGYTKGTTVTFGDPPRSLPFDQDGLASILCFGAITDLRMRLQGLNDEPIDMIDDHVHLFNTGDGLLEAIDADIAAHPEYRTDPKMRAMLGMIEAPAAP